MSDRLAQTSERARRALGALPVMVWNETPAGTVNGTNRTFTLVYTPFPIDSLMLFRNGQLVTQGVGNDFTLDKNVITFLNGSPSSVPQTGDTLRALYSKK